MFPIDTETIELLCVSAPRRLFVLVHNEGDTAADMLALGNVLGDAFADAAILIPQGVPRVESLAALASFAARM